MDDSVPQGYFGRGIGQRHMRARLVKLQVVDREGAAPDGQPLHC